MKKKIEIIWGNTPKDLMIQYNQFILPSNRYVYDLKFSTDSYYDSDDCVSVENLYLMIMYQDGENDDY